MCGKVITGGSVLGCVQEHAECEENDASFTCTCKTGYEGDGVKCCDIDECADGGTSACNVPPQPNRHSCLVGTEPRRECLALNLEPSTGRLEEK